MHRVVDAIEDALLHLQPALPGPVQVLNRPSLEAGDGEAMVDQAVAMLNELYDAVPPQRRGAY